MTPTTRSFAGFVLIAGIAVLGTALASQYWGGLAPCELCLYQRWPWYGAIAIALVALLLDPRGALPWLAAGLAAVFAGGAVLAFYHFGVEQHWFAGPAACTAGAAPQTIEELRRQILGQMPVLCDRVQWSLFGVSLAGWNLLASLAMAGYCLRAWRRPGGEARSAPVGRGAA